MRLVAGTFCYGNVVIHIMRMVFLIQTDPRVDIDQLAQCNSFSWYNNKFA